MHKVASYLNQTLVAIGFFPFGEQKFYSNMLLLLNNV